MSHRLFIAIELPHDVRRALAGLTAPIDGARWVREEQMHLTLRFIGDASEDEFRAVSTALQEATGEEFELGVQGVGCFPSPARPRVLWVGTRPEPRLSLLQENIEKAVQRVGFAPEARPFAPHLTLARLKEHSPAAVQRFLEKNASFALPPFPVKAFHLFSSSLSPKGATHRIERSYRLAARGE